MVKRYDQYCTKRRSITIAVVGTGYMGGGMAQVFALSGYRCLLADENFDIWTSPKALLEKTDAGDFGLKTGGGFVGLDVE